MVPDRKTKHLNLKYQHTRSTFKKCDLSRALGECDLDNCDKIDDFHYKTGSKNDLLTFEVLK